MVFPGALLPVASGHHPIFDPQLGGVSICVDDNSISAQVEGPAGLDPSAAEELRQRIQQSLHLESKRTGRAFYTRPACPPEAQQLRVEASARYLNPENYLGFPEDSYSFRAYLHVGELQSITSLTTANATLPFSWRAGGVYSESTERSPVIEHVSLASAAGLERLAEEWVEQNPEPGLKYWLVAITALAAVTVLVSVATANWKKPAGTAGRDE